MGFFNEHKKHIVITAAAGLVILSFVTLNKGISIPFVSGAISFITAPIQKVTVSVGDFIKEKLSYVTDTVGLNEENERLKEQITMLEAENKRLALYEEENEKLSALLEISQKYPSYETTGVQIIAKDPGNWYDIFIVDKGENDGIQKDMVLTDADGLVGKIIESSSVQSKAMSILDNRSSVSAMSVRTGDIGVVKGDYTLMNEGLCKMEYVDASAEIIEGDEIVTSHLSGLYPQGIVIGHVKEIKYDSNGLTKYAIIQPQADFKHLDTLLVMDGAKGDDNS